jgi:hypothetical protein
MKKMKDRHGNEAQMFDDATRKKQEYEKLIAALDRGLVTDEQGREVSMQQQILDLKTKLNTEEGTVRIIKSRYS